MTSNKQVANLHQKYQLQNVINASGRMTILGVSTPDPLVTETVAYGLNHFFVMKDLVNETGRYIADLLGVENAVVVSSASAGIAQAIAAVIIKDDPDLLVNMHAAIQNGTLTRPREIILAKGHHVNYGVPVGAMVSLGGGVVVEAGFANECQPEHVSAKINANTAAILYIKSHHCVQKSMLSVSEAAMVAKKHNIPLIVDAAAEEDLRCYYQMGADLVIYSGAKAIEGPSSGLVIGKNCYVEWVKQQSNGIGRAMKIGKEGILGLTQAIELYLLTDKISGQAMVDKMQPFIEKLNTLKGISACVVWDSAGRDIARTEITFDETVLQHSTKTIVQQLKAGETAVYFREYRVNEGKVEVDVRSVSNTQLMMIYDCILQVIH